MTFVFVNDTTFVQDMVLIFRSHEEVLDGVSSFTMHLDAIFLTRSFDAFTHSPDVNVRSIRLCCGGIANSSVRVVVCCCSISSSYFTLLIAHVGYLHLFRAWCRCFYSSCKDWGVEQMVLALWYSVPITLYFEGIL